MTEISIKIDTAQVDRAFREAPKKAKEAMRESLFEASLLVQNEAKRNSPILRGDLRRSITHEIKQLSAKIGSNKIYAPIQEFGGTIRPKNKKYLHFKVKGQWVRTTVSVIPAANNGKGYLRPALNDNKDKILKIFEKNFNAIFA